MMRIPIETSAREHLIDITGSVAEAVAASGVREGIAHVFSTHTTASVTVNENADPDVAHDLVSGLASIAPLDRGWRHTEGNSDAHMKAMLVGNDVTIPVSEGRLALGTWQAVYFCEFDGPRRRTVLVTVLPA